MGLFFITPLLGAPKGKAIEIGNNENSKKTEITLLHISLQPQLFPQIILKIARARLVQSRSPN
jgi:hypothetical protein